MMLCSILFEMLWIFLCLNRISFLNTLDSSVPNLLTLFFLWIESELCLRVVLKHDHMLCWLLVLYVPLFAFDLHLVSPIQQTPALSHRPVLQGLWQGFRSLVGDLWVEPLPFLHLPQLPRQLPIYVISFIALRWAFVIFVMKNCLLRKNLFAKVSRSYCALSVSQTSFVNSHVVNR